MADADDAREIIAILQETGFDAVAGELLQALAVRRERPDRDLTVDAADLDEEKTPKLIASEVFRRPAISPRPARQMDRPQTELEFALDFITTRLVQPAQALAEAERIVGELAEGPPASIEFTASPDGSERLPRGEAEAGEAEAAGRLADAVERVRREQGDGQA
jgi:hypothetical protein